jgi:hypothetical protein
VLHLIPDDDLPHAPSTECGCGPALVTVADDAGRPRAAIVHMTADYDIDDPILEVRPDRPAGRVVDRTTLPRLPADDGGMDGKEHPMQLEYSETATPVAVGDHVVVVDENYRPHHGLVTCVHGQFSEGGYVPCINVVYVSDDPAKRDPYGQQIERMSSLQHYSQGPDGMPKPGRFWANLAG